MRLTLTPTIPTIAPALDIDLAVVLQVQDIALTLSAILTEIEKGRLRDIGPVHETLLQLRARLDRLGTELTIRNFRRFVDHVVMPLGVAFAEVEVEIEDRPEAIRALRVHRTPRHVFTVRDIQDAWDNASSQSRAGLSNQLGISPEKLRYHLQKLHVTIDMLEGRAPFPCDA